MYDLKTIHIRLIMALSDAIAVEQIPVRRHEMEHMMRILQERYKPQGKVLETKHAVP